MTPRTERAPGPAVLHAWGPSAHGPEKDAELIDGFGAAPDAVITPSYWGGRRRESFAEELVRRGFDPRIGDLATELMGLERPAVEHSFLVEVEDGRICVSRLDFDAGLADSRLSFRGGDALEIIRDVAGELLADAGGAERVLDTGDVEFIVAAADDRLVADMRRRGWLAFPVPVELLGAEPLYDGADVHVGRRHAEAVGERPTVGDGAVPEEAGGLDVAALRRRARAKENARRRPRHRAPAVASAAVAVLACVVAAAAIVLIVDGPVGPALRDEAVLAAADGTDDGDARGEGEGAGGERGGGDDAGGGKHADGAVQGGSRGPDGAPPNSAAAPEARGIELVGNGVRVELPAGWRVDERVTAEALVLVDGGTMRVLVSAGEVPWGMDADGIVAGLTAHAAGDPAMDGVRREVIDGLDVVVHEERPPDGSVVLWQHKLVDGWQVSVGCQFRGATIPQVRPVCGRALRSAAVAGPE